MKKLYLLKKEGPVFERFISAVVAMKKLQGKNPVRPTT